MIVSLSKAEFDLLSNGGFLPPALGRRVSTAEIVNNVYVLSLDEDEADEIRDCCGDHLQEVGFDEEYKPTETGALLEAMIDKFFVG